MDTSTSLTIAPVQMSQRIIVADDDEGCRNLLLIALVAPDTEVSVATDGGELLDAVAERGPFDLIVTDINMPWMQGLQVLASLREAELATPVVVVTGMTDPQLPAAIARLGHAKLVHKPFTITELRAAVSELLPTEGCTWLAGSRSGSHP